MMSKSAKKLFIAMACVSMLLTFFVGCKQPNNGGGGLLNRKSLLNSKTSLTNLKILINPKILISLKILINPTILATPAILVIRKNLPKRS